MTIGEGFGDLRPAALAALTVEAIGLQGPGTDRQQGVDRFGHVLPHEVVEVTPMQLDRHEPSGLNAPQGVGIAERRMVPGRRCRPRTPQGARGTAGRPARSPPTWTLGLTPPTDLDNFAARFRAPGIAPSPEPVRRRTAFPSVRTRNRGPAPTPPSARRRFRTRRSRRLLDGLATGVLDEARRGVGADREALRADEPRQSPRRLAEAAADIDAASALQWRKTLEHLLGDVVERADEHVPVLLPPLIEHRPTPALPPRWTAQLGPNLAIESLLRG